MEDGRKMISADKRHRSSSSLVAGLDGTRSERKLDLRASKHEVDDQFAKAEARCNDLQEKIDLVKTLPKKKKLRKRSMTTIVEPVAVENVPIIKVLAQPKKKISQLAARLRRVEVSQKAHNSKRGYVDPDLVEQHQMVERMHGVNQDLNSEIQNKKKQYRPKIENSSKAGQQRGRADGDAMYGQGVQIDEKNLPQEVACGNEDNSFYLDENTYHRIDGMNNERTTEKRNDARQQYKKSPRMRLQRMPRVDESRDTWGLSPSASTRHHPKSYDNLENIHGNIYERDEQRPVVELFNKNRMPPELWQSPASCSTIRGKTKTGGSTEKMPAYTVPATPLKIKKMKSLRFLKRKVHRYEQPTVSSKMKQAGMSRSYEDDTKIVNIPFVVSKSTAPSHNVGVNLQQVLNGMKIRQPLSGIPLTMAHHMGLCHDPSNASKRTTATTPTLRNKEINMIKLGSKILRLFTSKNIPYSRLLQMYREGDGIVSRFLKTISRPHYFSNSNYMSRDATREIAAYANLFSEYETVQKNLEQKHDDKMAKRREELERELAAGENYILKIWGGREGGGTDVPFLPSFPSINLTFAVMAATQMVQELKPSEEVTLRATTSTAEEGCRHSTYKLHDEL